MSALRALRDRADQAASPQRRSWRSESVGGLFEIGSVESLSEAICHESSSMDSLLEKGGEGRKRVLERFTLDGNAEDFLAVYRRAISR